MAADPQRLGAMKAASKAAAAQFTWSREKDVLLGLYDRLRSRITSV
jgi:hypothetical protein